MAIRGNQGPSREIAPDVKVEAERIGPDVVRARTEQLWGNCADREAREHEPARSDLDLLEGLAQRRLEHGLQPQRRVPAMLEQDSGAIFLHYSEALRRHSDATQKALSARCIGTPQGRAISGHQWSSAAHRSTMYWNPTRAGLPTAAEYSLASSLRASMPSEAVRRTLTKPVRRIYHASRHRFGGATG